MCPPGDTIHEGVISFEAPTGKEFPHEEMDRACFRAVPDSFLRAGGGRGSSGHAHRVHDKGDHPRGADRHLQGAGPRSDGQGGGQDLHRRADQVQLPVARPHQGPSAVGGRHHRGVQHRLWRLAHADGHALSDRRRPRLHRHRGRGHHGRGRRDDPADRRRDAPERRCGRFPLRQLRLLHRAVPLQGA